MGQFKQIELAKKESAGLFEEEEASIFWRRMPYIEEDTHKAQGCQHEWKEILGIYKVYENCKHCGIKKEEVGDG